MAETAKIQTLHDHDTGEAVAPRTDIKALSGKGKKWNYVGFTEDDQVGLIEGTWPCNRNLLDNWYFRDPVNQRGQTEYTAPGYTIDRWGQTLGHSFTITDAGLSSSSMDFYQIFEIEGLRDTTVTLSALIDGELTTGTIKTLSVKPSSESRITLIPIATGGNLLFVEAYDKENTYQVSIMSDVNHVYTAIKLEVGPTQTLAHKEGDKWILNEIPDYAAELAKCQRYQVVFPFYSNVLGLIQVDGANATNGGAAFINVPVPLKKTPTLINPTIRGVFCTPSGTIMPVGITLTEAGYTPGETGVRCFFNTTDISVPAGSIGYSDRGAYLTSGTPLIGEPFIIDANI